MTQPPTTGEATVARNRDVQTELYGEPLADRFGRITERLGLTQSRVADTVGLSPAMLSQLIGARRIKIGNPAVLHRIEALEDLSDDVPATGLAERLLQIRDSAATTTRTSAATRPAETGSAGIVRGVQDVLRSAASAQDLLAAAALLEGEHPRLAEVLRVYGTGRTADAVAHHDRHVG